VKPAQADVAGVTLGARSTAAVLLDYIALTKPRLNLLVVATSGAGYFLGSTGAPDPLRMTLASVGAALSACGAAVLNQVYERRTDALMRRTRLRPLPDGRVSSGEAISFGAALSALGVGLLAFGVNAYSAWLALATIVIYLAVYTPLKRRSPIATLVGAVPGALPPLIGWAAARGSVTVGGWALFAIVFLWQIPHFMAIAWMYRDDYAKAGFPMLPVLEPDGRRTGRQAVLYAAALIPLSLAPSFLGVSGRVYYWSALVLGIALLMLALRFSRARTEASARALFFGSITYLPLLWAVMIFDRP
jgi:protoheme IX farnesyltransferase